ncbi:MAG: hypothetical protein ABSG99_04235 [Sedimentisphaerales bacterium]
MKVLVDINHPSQVHLFKYVIAELRKHGHNVIVTASQKDVSYKLLDSYDLRVRDVEVKPVYNIGEKSMMKMQKVIVTLSWLLLKDFLYRLKEKYIIRDFHPLFFFYAFGFLFDIVTVLLFIRLFYIWFSTGHIPPINAPAAMFSFISAVQFTLFARWFDMESNKDLK